MTQQRALYDYLYHLAQSGVVTDIEDLIEAQRQQALDLYALEGADYAVNEMVQEIDGSLARAMTAFIRLPQGENIGKLQIELTQHFWCNAKREISDILDSILSEFSSEPNEEHRIVDNAERIKDFKAA